MKNLSKIFEFDLNLNDFDIIAFNYLKFFQTIIDVIVNKIRDYYYY